jgi:hypothetical protein
MHVDPLVIALPFSVVADPPLASPPTFPYYLYKGKRREPWVGNERKGRA